MNLGIAATVFGRNRFLIPADLALLPEIGVYDTEISFLHRRLDYRNEPYVDELVQAVQRLKIRVPSVHALAGAEDADMSSLDEEKRTWAVNQIQIGADLLSRLGGRFLVVHVSHGIGQREDRAMRLECVTKSLRDLAGYCAPKGIVIAVENLPGDRLCNNSEELRTLVERFGPQEVGICFDIGHANMHGDPVATFRRIGDRVVALHISDNSGVADNHDLPYTGTIDWPAFMRAMEESGFEGAFMYEVAPLTNAQQDLHEITKNYARLLI